jgi:hypothetical protein
MIVGKQFVWLHFPKSGGHAVDQALKAALKGNEAAFDPPDYVGWHDSIEDRRRRDSSNQLAGKTLISGFRRLPYWMLSRIHYEAARPPYLAASRDMLRRGEFFHQNGQIGRADEYIVHYDAARISRWVRTEHLAQDFLEHFGAILGPGVAGAAIRKVRRIVNGAQLNYIRDLGFYFTPDELSGLYEANPLWAELERRLYGGLLTVGDRRSDLFYFVDRKLRFMAASAPTLDEWGLSLDQVLGRDVLSVFPMVRGTDQYLGHFRALETMRTLELDVVSARRADHPVRIRYEPKPAGVAVRYEFIGGL